MKILQSFFFCTVSICLRVGVQLLVLGFILASFIVFVVFFHVALGLYVFTAFTAFVLFYGVFELDVCGIRDFKIRDATAVRRDRK